MTSNDSTFVTSCTVDYMFKTFWAEANAPQILCNGGDLSRYIHDNTCTLYFGLSCSHIGQSCHNNCSQCCSYIVQSIASWCSCFQKRINGNLIKLDCGKKDKGVQSGIYCMNPDEINLDWVSKKCQFQIFLMHMTLVDNSSIEKLKGQYLILWQDS